MEVANQTSWNRSQFSFQDERNHHPEASQPWAGMHTKLIIGMKVKAILPFLVMAFPPPPTSPQYFLHLSNPSSRKGCFFI